jgi:signal transduction histidine kinase
MSRSSKDPTRNLGTALPLRGSTRSREPGAGMFRGVRLRLTLWYCSVLAVALVLFGAALYVGVEQVLFRSTQDYLTEHALERARQWQYAPIAPCSSMSSSPIFRHGPYDERPTEPDPNLMVACFDQNDTLIGNISGGQTSAAFLSNSLAKKAWQTGQPVNDIVDGGGSTGPIYRCAQIITVRNSQRIVLQVGTSVSVQEDTLHILLTLLLILGTLALIGAGMGGLFLAHRALEPTRQAFTQQQRFIADASHELRTPLTLLHADADVLLRGRKRLAEEDVVLLEDIVSEVNHMATLTNRMLTLARLDAGDIDHHREHEVVYLDQVTQAVVQRVKAFAEQQEITLKIENQGAPCVIGDSSLLEQAVLVLIDNAIKYNHQGGSVSILTAVRDNDALIEVRDTGVGIASRHLPHLGERFYRVDKARSREAGGTGLGLSIAHGIAKVHNGTLTLTSVPGEGTTAMLRLPQAHSTSTQKPAPIETPDAV